MSEEEYLSTLGGNRFVHHLLERPLPLVRGFTENLLAYAIGRRVEHFDQPTVRAIARDARKQLPDMLQALRQLPPLVENAIQRASDGQFRVPLDTREIERLQRTIRDDGRRRDVTLASAVAALSGVLLIIFDTGPQWLGYAVLAASLVGLFSLRK